jgi:hypothetical protein
MAARDKTHWREKPAQSFDPATSWHREMVKTVLQESTGSSIIPENSALTRRPKPLRSIVENNDRWPDDKLPLHVLLVEASGIPCQDTIIARFENM